MPGQSPGAAAVTVITVIFALILAPDPTSGARPAAKDVGNANATRAWLPGNYPIPLRDPGLCGHTDVVKTEFLCDPDGILTDHEADKVDYLIQEIAEAVPPYRAARCQAGRNHPGFEVAVALMRRMDDRFGRGTEFNSNHMVETLVRSWAVGGVACQVGFLILYVEEGHHVRLAAGRPLRDVAGEEEMHRVVAKIRPLLKKGKVADAIMLAIRELLSLLITNDEFLEQSETSRAPTTITLFVVVTLIAIALLLWRLWGRLPWRRSNTGRRSDDD
ncbi:hypothetical protein WJX73_002083 [Symbiochloris irregularis]|uniref:TPM domain-containing protein n=1 Tax=Symbiochloris irregularis TaxID=706552 RepID=A0AAW1PLN6_9CHLO